MKRAIRLLLLLGLRVLAVAAIMLWATARLGTLSVAVPMGGRSVGFASTTNGLILGSEPSDGATRSSWRFRSYLAAMDESSVTMEAVFGNRGNVMENHVWLRSDRQISFLGLSYPVCLIVVLIAYALVAFLFRKQRRNRLLRDK